MINGMCYFKTLTFSVMHCSLPDRNVCGFEATLVRARGFAMWGRGMKGKIIGEDFLVSPRGSDCIYYFRSVFVSRHRIVHFFLYILKKKQSTL